MRKPVQVMVGAEPVRVKGLKVRPGDGPAVSDEDGGADELLGGAGDDPLYGDGGADVLDGEAGDDLVRGGSGDDALTRGAGSDPLNGRGRADTLAGDGGGASPGDAGDGRNIRCSAETVIVNRLVDLNGDLVGNAGDDASRA